MAKPASIPAQMDSIALLTTARRVLNAEASALNDVATQLDDRFIVALNIIVGCKGRVIVTGMGKSGHISRKMAATFSSTGTPAIFVHPGEASHGDLGMITASDVVIAISNSGEATELADLIGYTRRFSIPLIAITGREQSTLASAADVTLLLANAPEVCPMGLAPTTSTTMMLALGDALAVAIMEYKGFTADDYRNFHPGGKLGKTLLRVSEVMHEGEEIPLATENDVMSHILVVMTQKSFGCTGIVDKDGKLVGVITDGDLRRHMQSGLLNMKATEIMTRSPMTTTPKTLAAEALKILNDKKRTNLFVVDNGLPVGILHIHDLLRAGIA